MDNRIAEIEALFAEFKATRPKSSKWISKNTERWENDYQARHRLDLATDESKNGAIIDAVRYAFSPVQDDCFERMMAAEYAS